MCLSALLAVTVAQIQSTAPNKLKWGSDPSETYILVGPKIDLWIENEPIERVLARFKGVLRIAKTDVPLKGRVTAKLLNFPAHQALNIVLKPLGAACSYQGKYTVIDYPLLGKPLIDSKSKVSIKAVKQEIRDILRVWAKAADYSYTVSTDVKGKVSLDVKAQDPGPTLEAILTQVGAEYRVEGGIINIIKLKSESLAPPDLSTLVPYFLIASESRLSALSRLARQTNISINAERDVDLSEKVTTLIEKKNLKDSLQIILGPNIS